MSFEDDYLDVLENIEFGIVSVYRDDRSVLDSDALEAVNALVRYYDSGRNSARLGVRSQRIFDSVRNLIALRMERGRPLNTTAEIVVCLKRISKSISFWTKEGGRQGYLSFVGQHMGPVFGDSEA